MIKFVSDLGHATNTTDHHGITEILLKVALNAIKQTTNNSILYNNLLIAHFPIYDLLPVCNKNNATNATHGTETVNSSGTHGLPAFWWRPCYSSFSLLSVLCCVFFICLFLFLFL
jgi:hypothetical protein